jgi:hypothetical protein
MSTYFSQVDRALPFHSVLNHGATGDGIADDQQEVQAAIDAAATAGGGVVWFPAGTYLITDPLTLSGPTYDGIVLAGAGRDQTTILQDAVWDGTGSKPGILIVDADAVTIQDLTLKHNNSPGSSPGTCCTAAQDGEPGNAYVAGIYSRSTAAMVGPHVLRVRVEDFIIGVRPRGDTNYVAATVGTYIEDLEVRNVVHGILSQLQDDMEIRGLDAWLDEHTDSAGPAHPVYMTLGVTQVTQNRPVIRDIACRPYDDDNVDCSTSLRRVDGANVQGITVVSPSSGLSAKATFHCNGMSNSIVTDVVGVDLDPGSGGGAFVVWCGSSSAPPCEDNLFANVNIELATDVDRLILQLEDAGTTTNVTRNVFRDFYLRNDKSTTNLPSVTIEGEGNELDGLTLEQLNSAGAAMLIGGGTDNRITDYTCLNCTTTGSMYRAGTAQTGLFLRYMDNNGVGQGRLLGAGSGNFGDSGVVADGSVVYCPDCLVDTNPCTSGGTGTNAWRRNDAWVCGISVGGSDGQVQYNDSNAFGGDPNFTWDDVQNQCTMRRGAADGAALFLGYDDAPVSMTLGKTPLLQLTGDDDAVSSGVVNRGPTIALIKPDIDVLNADQSAAEVYLAATASPISEFGGVLDAVADGDVLGRVGFFGSDGVASTMQTRGCSITAVVDTSVEAVASGQIPTQMRIQTADAAPIVFGTNVGNLCCNGQATTGRRVIILPTGEVVIDSIVGVGGLTTAAAACIANDGADRIFHDTDCDEVKDAGEEYIDQTGGGTGDIDAVMGCGSGDCSAVTAAAGDSLNMTSGDSSIPCVVQSDCSTETTQGMCCVDSDDNRRCWGDGSTCVFEGVENIWYPAAGCNNATPSVLWDLPTANAPAPACVTGSNTQKGVLDFDPTTDESAQQHVMLPSDWVGTVDLDIKWLTTATTGNVVWAAQTSCVADGETDDPAWDTAGTVTDAAKGTANQTNDATITSIPVTQCAAGELMHLRFYRDADNVSDTINANDTRLIGTLLTLRRTS